MHEACLRSSYMCIWVGWAAGAGWWLVHVVCYFCACHIPYEDMMCAAPLRLPSLALAPAL